MELSPPRPRSSAMTVSAISRFLHSTIADLEQDLDVLEDLLGQGEGYDRKVRLLAYAGYRNEKTVRLREIEAAGVPTFCGAGFGDAVAVVEKLALDRPIEAASAVLAPAGKGQ